MPAAGAGTAGGRAGERGRGREIGKGAATPPRGEASPAHPGGAPVSAERARGAGPAQPGGGRTEPGGGAEPPRGNGEGPAAAALICKQKERHDPNKSGRAGGTRAPLRTAWFRDPRSPAPRPAPPRSLGGPASPLDQVLQLALRRETGEAR